MCNKLCPKCQVEKPLKDFYSTPSRPVAGICKECFNKFCIARWIQRKIDAIKYKGCKCKDCGISYPEIHYSVFEFHHLDPSQKDYNWTKLRLRSLESIKNELDKCVMLCANCHRVRHSL